MDKNYWLERWETNNIPFHLEQTNPNLLKYQQFFTAKTNNNIFLPLCGKTLDIKWLLSQNQNIIGVELSEKAVIELFENLGVNPKVNVLRDMKLYYSRNVTIYVGNIFSLTKELIGNIDYIYDRAALVALPKEVRIKYTSHLMNITNSAEQLLITYNYDQTLMDGPPFSVSLHEIEGHYSKHYSIKILETLKIPNGLKGICPATEEIWYLKKNV